MLPRFYVITHLLGFKIGAIVFVMGGIAAQVLLISPAAFIYAGSGTCNPVLRRRASIAGRWMLGVPLIIFGAGTSRQRQWLCSIRSSLGSVSVSLWVVLTGISFMLAGCAIVNRHPGSARR